MAQVPATDDIYTGDGTTTQFAISFEYLQPTDVKVSVDGVIVPYTYAAPGLINVSPAPAVGSVVRVYRDTPAEEVAYTFSNGVPFLLKYADTNWKKMLFAFQESWAEFKNNSKNYLKTLRTPEDINSLPLKEDRSGKLLSFDTDGQPLMLEASLDSVPVLDYRVTTLENKAVTRIPNWAAISTTPVAFAGQLFELAQHTSNGLGGGVLMAFAGSVTDDGGTQKNSGTSGFYLKRVGYLQLTPYDFGCVGSGNEYSKMQAALDKGVNIYVPIGLNISTDTELRLKANNQQLTVDGTIKALAAMSSVVHCIDLDYAGVTGNGVIDGNNLAINGIEFTAQAKNPVGNFAENINITGTASDPNLFYGCVLFVNTGGAAGSFRCKDVRAENIKAFNCGTHGVLAAYCDGVRILGNVFKSVQNHGHESVGCSNVVIKGNTAINCGISGIGVGARTYNFVISGNTVIGCGGDGSITCEQNSIRGVISNNSCYDCKTQGINVSFGTTGSAPFNKIRDITVSDNIVVASSADGPTHIGINAYSSTGAGLGEGIVIRDNTFDGFNIGISYSYMSYGSVSGNTVLNLTGSNSKMIVCTLVTNTDILNNKCNTDTGDHAIKILSYMGTISNRVNISLNQILSSGAGAKSLVYIEGSGQFNCSSNSTSGSSNYVEVKSGDTAIVMVNENYGNVVTPFSGNEIFNYLGHANSLSVGAAGSGASLPATPKGYVSVAVPGVGQVKIPFYNI